MARADRARPDATDEEATGTMGFLGHLDELRISASSLPPLCSTTHGAGRVSPTNS